MKIVYRTNLVPSVEEVIELYGDAGLQRPIDDGKRIKQMIANSNLFVSAWINDELIGLARSLTDWSWCCYLADLAVKDKYKRSGIGKTLIQLTRKEIGKRCMLLLLSVPGAMDYYPKIGFEKCENGFIQKREK